MYRLVQLRGPNRSHWSIQTAFPTQDGRHDLHHALQAEHASVRTNLGVYARPVDYLGIILIRLHVHVNSEERGVDPACDV